MLVLCGSSLLLRLLTLDGVGRVACQGCLVREARFGVFCGWIWISSLWSAMKCPFVGFEVSVCLV